MAASSIFDEFPDKPKGMHWRTYDLLQAGHDAADNRSMAGLTQFLLRQTGYA